LKAVKVYPLPGRIELVLDVTIEIGIFPFRRAHNVIVVTANHITIASTIVKQFRVYIGIVGDIANM
jgi:hypothetical protein